MHMTKIALVWLRGLADEGSGLTSIFEYKFSLAATGLGISVFEQGRIPAGGWST
jgi:hypothetical protein